MTQKTQRIIDNLNSTEFNSLDASTIMSISNDNSEKMSEIIQELSNNTQVNKLLAYEIENPTNEDSIVTGFIKNEKLSIEEKIDICKKLVNTHGNIPQSNMFKSALASTNVNMTNQDIDLLYALNDFAHLDIKDIVDGFYDKNQENKKSQTLDGNQPNNDI